MREREDYHRILGVDPEASEDEIREAYRSKGKQYHPDIFMNQPQWVRAEAEIMTRKLNEAYAALSDADRRSDYDKGMRRES